MQRVHRSARPVTQATPDKTAIAGRLPNLFAQSSAVLEKLTDWCDPYWPPTVIDIAYERRIETGWLLCLRNRGALHLLSMGHR
jgi:hypothetical protein